MKVVVSYISSLYDRRETILKISETSADAIHADLMDGKYAGEVNFTISDPSAYIEEANFPVEFHLMTLKPSGYLNSLYSLNPTCIYIHPETEDNPKEILEDIKNHDIEPAIVINPDEDISKYEYLYSYVGRVLLMSVVPGYGGQKFIEATTNRLDELLEYKRIYNFEIFIDGGINSETIDKVLNADGVVSGSFICKSENYEESIRKLKK